MLKKDLGLFLLIVAVGAVVAFINPRFISPINLANTANLIGLFGLFSIGEGSRRAGEGLPADSHLARGTRPGLAVQRARPSERRGSELLSVAARERLVQAPGHLALPGDPASHPRPHHARVPALARSPRARAGPLALTDAKLPLSGSIAARSCAKVVDVAGVVRSRILRWEIRTTFTPRAWATRSSRTSCSRHPVTDPARLAATL